MRIMRLRQRTVGHTPSLIIAKRQFVAPRSQSYHTSTLCNPSSVFDHDFSSRLWLEVELLHVELAAFTLCIHAKCWLSVVSGVLDITDSWSAFRFPANRACFRGS